MLSSKSADSELVGAAKGGDPHAFNLLVVRWERKLYNYLLRSTGNREDAMDLCQEAFLKACRGLPTLASAERFPNWLFRIAHNELVSSHRRARPTSCLDDLDQLPDIASLPRSRLGDFGYGGPELSFLVEQALSTLPAAQREVVVLKVQYGFKFDEIAEIVGCPVSTAKSRLYAALAALREALQPVSARA